MSEVTWPIDFPTDRAEAAAWMEAQIAAIMTGERDPVANMANTASILGHGLSDINWVGFYVVRGDELVLGPFWGLPACIRIARGRGVCGTSWARRTPLIVPDVLEFPGHIACDARSRSEIVVPIEIATPGRIVGVLDCDAPVPNRFGALEQRLLEAVARLLAKGSDWPL